MTIRVFAQGTVTRENRSEFREIVKELVDNVRRTEAGKTLVYDFYLSDSDEPGNCTIHEAYVDGPAFSLHFDALGANLARITRVFKTEKMRISGETPAAILEALAPIGDLQNYPDTVAEL